MKCPKCGSKDIYVINTYSAGSAGKTQRCQCKGCGAVLVTSTVIVEVDPPRGKGAKALARELEEALPPVSDRA